MQISPEAKRRPQRAFWGILMVVALLLLGTVTFIKPWAKDKRELAGSGGSGGHLSDRRRDHQFLHRRGAARPVRGAARRSQRR